MVERNRALAGIIDMVREELPNYPLLPVDERAQDFPRWRTSCAMGAALTWQPMRAPTIAVPAGVMDLEALYAEIVVLLAETDFDYLSRQVHLQVQLGRSKVAYAISASAMFALPRHRLVDLLTGKSRARWLTHSLTTGACLITAGGGGGARYARIRKSRPAVLEWANRPGLEGQGHRGCDRGHVSDDVPARQHVGAVSPEPGLHHRGHGAALGRGFKGASKRLRSGFAGSTRTAWWCGSSKWPATSGAKDNRCKGIQREYEGLPENPYLEPFYENTGCFSHDFEAI